MNNIEIGRKIREPVCWNCARVKKYKVESEMGKTTTYYPCDLYLSGEPCAYVPSGD